MGEYRAPAPVLVSLVADAWPTRLGVCVGSALPSGGHGDEPWASLKSSDAPVAVTKAGGAPHVTRRGHRRLSLTRSISRFERVFDGRHHAHLQTAQARAVAAWRQDGTENLDLDGAPKHCLAPLLRHRNICHSSDGSRGPEEGPLGPTPCINTDRPPPYRAARVVLSQGRDRPIPRRS